MTNRYIYNPEGQLIGELDAQGNLLKTFIYASKSHVPDYFIDSSNVRYKLIVDQLGSVRLVVNATTGKVEEKMIHDEFGKVLTDSRPGFIPFGFAGGLYDSETKLVRFGARDYDSETGRWTNKDPIRFKGGDSNLYGYVLQDPVNGIDPSGLFVTEIVFGFGTYIFTGDDLAGLPESNPEAFKKYQENLYSERVLKSWENKIYLDKYLRRLERRNKEDPNSYRCI